MSVQSFSLQVPKVKKRRWGKPKPGESLKMLAAGSLAFAKAYSSVEKLEHELEAEIQRDKENDPKRGKGFHKWRRKGGKWLLSKYLLLFIVVVNIIDCALVLGELILDLHHVKDILSVANETTVNFILDLKTMYPDQFARISSAQIDLAYQKVLTAKLIWSEDADNGTLARSFVGNKTTLPADVTSPSDFSSRELTNSANISDGATKKNLSGAYGGPTTFTGSEYDIQSSYRYARSQGKPENVLGLVGFVFHKFSLTISMFLVLWILLKIICFGRHLLDRRLEVFDTCVILVSFIIDMIFVKGLSSYSLQEFVFILAFMLPWRVIRVTNSLVVAVKDHEHFRLKMLFTQKKKIEHDNKQLRNDRDNYKEQVESLRKLCLQEGIDDWKVFQSLARQHVRPGGKGAMGSFASLAFGAFGNKSTSFWSVLGTPKMRRGKSMELVDNKIIHQDNLFAPVKHHSKGKLLGFLGSSADFIKGKVKNGHHHHLSLESDPNLSASYLRQNCQPNGHIGKRLVRGETIDTQSTDSLDWATDKAAEMDDISRQETMDSSVYGESFNSHVTDPFSMQRANSDDCSHPLSDISTEEVALPPRPRSASASARASESLRVPPKLVCQRPHLRRGSKQVAKDDGDESE